MVDSSVKVRWHWHPTLGGQVSGARRGSIGGPDADPQGRGHRGNVPPKPMVILFKRKDELLCSLIQHTEYCSCCASFYHHSLPVCITIHLYLSLGVEHGARFVAFSGQLRFRHLLKAYLSYFLSCHPTSTKKANLICRSTSGTIIFKVRVREWSERKIFDRHHA